MKPTAFSKVEEAAEALLILDNDLRLALRCCAATIIANTEEGTPALWLMLVGGSSNGKTAAIEPFLGSAFTHKLDIITPRAFLSGFKAEEDGPEPSLLKRLGSLKTLVVTDFSMILGMQRDQREAIVSQMRTVYDGSLAGGWGGAKVEDKWKGKMGMIAACTEEIHKYRGVMGQLGERFIYLHVKQSDPKAAARKAAYLVNENKIKTNMEKVAAAFIEFKAPGMEDIEINSEALEAIMSLAQLTANLRTHVGHDENSRDKRTMVYDPDGPTRVMKQLRQLARGLAAVRGAKEVGRRDVADCKRVALDSVQQDRRYVLDILWAARTPDPVSLNGHFPLGVEGITERQGKYTTITVRRALGDMELVGLVEKKGKVGKTDLFVLTKKVTDLLHPIDAFALKPQ